VVEGAYHHDSTTIEVEITATGPANLLGQPAISVPCGFVDGLPVGLHLQGREFDDGLVLRAAMVYQQATGTPPLAPLQSATGSDVR
jgi:aspartyl-tRNA(Asn)/glutamyl-tRNA(Gln) amidotransferase subunit A